MFTRSTQSVVQILYCIKSVYSGNRGREADRYKNSWRFSSRGMRNVKRESHTASVDFMMQCALFKPNILCHLSNCFRVSHSWLCPEVE